jgi:hypothetical protein
VCACLARRVNKSNMCVVTDSSSGTQMAGDFLTLFSHAPWHDIMVGCVADTPHIHLCFILERRCVHQDAYIVIYYKSFVLISFLSRVDNVFNWGGSYGLRW